VEEYFGKAIPQFISRVDRALELIPVDMSSEQLVLASRCTGKLQELRNKLENLANDPNAKEIQYRTERFREFQRIVRDIEYVETVGIAALERSNDVDEKLNRLVQVIRKEIDYPLRLPPAVTTISRDYFYVHTRFNFNLICVPPGERHSLLHLPDLYHELAHPLLLETDPAQIRVFQGSLTTIRDMVLSHFLQEIESRKRQRGPDLYKSQPEVWLQNWYRSWATEFLCDLFAIYTLGPAFAWAHYHLCAKKTIDPFETPSNSSITHPADDARMMLMLFALDRIGFADAANAIEARWKELTDSCSSIKASDYLQCYPRTLLGQIEDIAYFAIVKMKMRVAGPGTDSYVHKVLNEAWVTFWEDQDSYIEWESAEVEKLYSHCLSSVTQVRTVNAQNEVGKEMQPGEIEKTSGTQRHQNRLQGAEGVFRNALSELKASVSANEALMKKYPILGSDDIQNLEFLIADPPRGGIYDHLVFERKFYLSKKLIQGFESYWNTENTSNDESKRMCKLFLLHEFLHIEQHVDSNTYKYSGDSKNSFRYIDYDADAFAVEVCFETETSFLTWNNHLMNVLVAHAKTGNIFAHVDDDKGSSVIEGDRLHRQAIWFLQYARSRAFKVERSFDEFLLPRHIIIEIFSLSANGNRENLCSKGLVTRDDFENPIEMHISWGGNRIRYHLTNRHYLDSFGAGIFDSDFDSISEAFRPLFDSNPELVGRSLQNPGSNRNNLEISFDRIDFMQKLYSLHVEDLGKIITSIPEASQKISSNDTSARKIEQLVSWAESGTGPGISQIYKTARKLYPLHFA
jgi:hypothetical protein